jgi:hypothetical protein
MSKGKRSGSDGRAALNAEIAKDLPAFTHNLFGAGR